VTIRRAAGYGAIGELVVPLVVLLLTELQGGAFAWPRVALAFWPTSWMMMAVEGLNGGVFTPAGAVILLVSVAANVALYTVVGGLAGLLAGR
jgi:hypothetical protein